MALLPTGSNKLLEINTEEVNIVIKSKRNWQGISLDQSSSVVVEGRRIYRVSMENIGDENSYDEAEYSRFEIGVPPMFFEQTDYEIVVNSNVGESVSVWNENYSIREKIGPVIEKNESIVSGIINFDNMVGFADFEVYVANRKSVSFRIEVFPTKISYKEDYQLMIDDISEMVCEVALDFMQKTYQMFSIGDRHNTVLSVYFQILSVIFKDYMNAVNRIISVPHHKLITEHAIVSEHKAKRTDRASEKWLMKHQNFISIENGVICAEKILAVRKQITYDTAENKFVKFILKSTVRKLEDFIKRYSRAVVQTEKKVLDDANEMVRDVKRALNTSFLQNVSEYSAAQSMSLVFGMAPGYRELYKCYIMLQRSLSLNGDVFRMSPKDTAQLYEYWCFIKLYSLLKKDYELKTPDIIKVDNNGITVTLIRGTKSEARFFNSKTGETITLVYNPGESKTQTVNQRPDNVLELEKQGSDVAYKYVFDAKYRIESNPDSSFYPDSMPGPKVDDINTMHRYRDSIVYENKKSKFMFEKTMFGAYILFPLGDEEQYRSHRFYKSIDTVNIGGLPFLPGSTRLVQKLLSELINDSKESAFERTTLPRGIEEKLERVDWARRDVLVGVFRTLTQFEICKEKRLYYTPASNIPESRLPIHYVALYETKEMYRKANSPDQGKIKYYGEVIGFSKVKRRNIVEVPMSRNNPEEPYYRIYVKEWKEVADINEFGKPILPKESGFVVDFTNMFLLEHSEFVPDLQIKDEAQYRFYTELRRTAEKARISEGEANIGFEYCDTKLIFVDGNIQPIQGDKLLEPISVVEFNKHPGRTFRALQYAIGVNKNDS